MAHNLKWGDVRRVLDAVAEVTAGHNGQLTVIRHGWTLHLPDHASRDVVSLPDVKRIRDFLEQTELPSKVTPAADGRHWLVVVDHSCARIFHTEMHESKPVRVTPHDREGHGREIHQFRTDGKHRPIRKEFYDAVADSLRGADHVLMFGHGTGESGAMNELFANLERLHPDLARRVIGRVVIDPSHTSVDQLLARAREFYSVVPKK
jgi:hypothetical protein